MRTAKATTEMMACGLDVLPLSAVVFVVFLPSG
jgi:hypothetical protein